MRLWGGGEASVCRVFRSRLDSHVKGPSPGITSPRPRINVPSFHTVFIRPPPVHRPASACSPSSTGNRRNNLIVGSPFAPSAFTGISGCASGRVAANGEMTCRFVLRSAHFYGCMPASLCKHQYMLEGSMENKREVLRITATPVPIMSADLLSSIGIFFCVCVFSFMLNTLSVLGR